MPRDGLLGHRAAVLLQKSPSCLTDWLQRSTSPRSVHMFTFPTPVPACVLFHFWVKAIPTAVRWYLRVVLMCIYWIINVVGYLFILPLAIFCGIFEVMPIHIFARLCVFVCVRCMHVMYVHVYVCVVYMYLWVWYMCVWYMHTCVVYVAYAYVCVVCVCVVCTCVYGFLAPECECSQREEEDIRFLLYHSPP